jgi:hypothetical protein
VKNRIGLGHIRDRTAGHTGVRPHERRAGDADHAKRPRRGTAATSSPPTASPDHGSGPAQPTAMPKIVTPAVTAVPAKIARAGAQPAGRPRCSDLTRLQQHAAGLNRGQREGEPSCGEQNRPQHRRHDSTGVPMHGDDDGRAEKHRKRQPARKSAGQIAGCSQRSTEPRTRSGHDRRAVGFHLAAPPLVKRPGIEPHESSGQSSGRCHARSTPRFLSPAEATRAMERNSRSSTARPSAVSRTGRCRPFSSSGSISPFDSRRVSAPYSRAQPVARQLLDRRVDGVSVQRPPASAHNTSVCAASTRPGGHDRTGCRTRRRPYPRKDQTYVRRNG